MILQQVRDVGSGRKNPNSLRLFVPKGLRALRSLQIAGAISRTTSMDLIQSLNWIHKKAPLNEVLFIGNAVGVGTEEFKQA